MGYAFVMGVCGSCGAMFSFNPVRVPSFKNVPYCRECVEAANPTRVKNGLPPIRYASDAYSPVDENELR